MMELKVGDWVAFESYICGCCVQRAFSVVAIGKRIKVTRYPEEAGAEYKLLKPSEVWRVFPSKEAGDEACKRAKDIWWEEQAKVMACEKERDRLCRKALTTTPEA